MLQTVLISHACVAPGRRQHLHNGLRPLRGFHRPGLLHRAVHLRHQSAPVSFPGARFGAPGLRVNMAMTLLETITVCKRASEYPVRALCGRDRRCPGLS